MDIRDNIRIGVLGLQGAVREHVQALEANGVEAVIIRKKEQLNDIDGFIIPGGESTTIGRLIGHYDFMNALKEFAASGKPMFGTSAGLILLAKSIEGYVESYIGVIDVRIERNCYGRQKESFEAEIDIAGVADEFTAVFIRAPHIVSAGEDVEILAKHNGRIVAVREGSFLACSFHPELTDDHRLTEYFIRMVKESKI